MPAITDRPPRAVQSDLAALRDHLAATLPARRTHQNLLIATWNIRAFASLTRQWTAGTHDSPKRDLRGLLAIAEIISRFDIIAIQELKGDLRALRDLLKWLGGDWAFLMTDITLGAAGNDERMAFLFDRRRVKPSGLACELVIPPEWLQRDPDIHPEALTRQFVRTPYAVSFQAANATVILATLHVDYGDTPAARIPELTGIAQWLRAWANRSNSWSHNLIALGDFNIDRRGDPLWQAFTSTGLTTPAQLDAAPRTVFAGQDDPEKKFYDQIAWFETASGVKQLSMAFVDAGYVDFMPFVYTDQSLSTRSISYRISDHYPLWAEFATG